MPEPFVLVSSPLLPLGWDAVAAALSAPGREVLVLDPRIPDSADPVDLVATLSTRLPERSILVPHSGAGLLAPALVASGRVARTVYVDAALPAGPGRAPIAPPALVDALADRVEHGMLPPWTRWWDPSEIAELYADAGMRDRVDRAAPSIPLAWLRAAIAVPSGWDTHPSAYLAFGDTYADELAFARRAGWPTERLEGAHLHHLLAPADVAESVVRLADPAG